MSFWKITARQEQGIRSSHLGGEVEEADTEEGEEDAVVAAAASE